MQSLLVDYGIHMYSSYTSIKVSVIERLIRTIMGRLARHWFVNKTKRWDDVIESLCDSYNKTKHSSLGISAAEVSTENSPEVFRRLYHRLITANRKDAKYKIGMRVNISARKFKLFRKGYQQNFSSDAYTIIAVHLTHPVTYTIADGEGDIIPGSLYEQELVAFVEEKP